MRRASAQLAQERAYRHIKEAIIMVRFPPGQRLGTEEIAAEISASRTPVREALSRLAQEGLVQREGGWGYVVRPISVKDVLDLFNVRQALEVEAARLVIAHLNDQVMAELVAMNECAEAHFKSGAYDEFLKQNRQFHEAIAGATQNALLRQMLGSIHDRVRQVGTLTVRAHKARLKELLDENRQILTAIRRRDAAALENAVRSHLERGRQHIVQMIAGDLNDRIPIALAKAS